MAENTDPKKQKSLDEAIEEELRLRREGNSLRRTEVDNQSTILNQNTDLAKKFVAAQSTQAGIIGAFSSSTKKTLSKGFDFIKSAKKVLSEFSDNTGEFLRKNDQALRDTALNLGTSKDNAQAFNQTILDSNDYASRLNASFEDLNTIYSVFSNETGRVYDLNQKNLESIIKIQKGLGLTAEAASKLSSEFVSQGFSAENTSEYISDVLKKTEKLGIVGKRAISDIEKNLKQSQRYSFKEGAQGIAEMAANAQKFKMSMESSFKSMDQFSTLEGAVDSFANLQVLGGKFAQMDFFDMMYKAQYDPTGFQESISKSLTDVAKMDKNGVIKIEPVDIKRLREASKALQIPEDELREMAMQQARIKELSRTLGKGIFSPEEITTLNNISSLNKGNFTIKSQTGVDKTGKAIFADKNIKDLSTTQIKDVIKTLNDNAEKNGNTLEKSAINNMGVDKMVESGSKMFENSMTNIFIPEVESLVKAMGDLKNSFSKSSITGPLAMSKALKDADLIDILGAPDIMKTFGDKINNISQGLDKMTNYSADQIKEGGGLRNTYDNVLHGMDEFIDDGKKYFNNATNILEDSRKFLKNIFDKDKVESGGGKRSSLLPNFDFNSKESSLENEIKLLKLSIEKLSQGIPVKFEEKDVSIKVNIDNNINTDTIYKEVKSKMINIPKGNH